MTLMKLFINLLITFFYLFFFTILFAQDSYFKEGKELFELKKYKDSKFKFEKDIVFHPKNEKSYLYLAKIFNKEGNDDLEENNLNTVVLLNPKNEEAIYLLADLNIKKSDFSKAKELIDTLEIVCEKLCSSQKGLLEKLESLSKQ